MKRLVASLLTGLLLFSLGACQRPGTVIPIGEVTSSLDVLKELPDYVAGTFALAQETTYHLEQLGGFNR